MKDIESNITDTSLEAIKGILESNTEIVIVAPWNGEPLPVTIVMLSSVSLNSCGDFSTIDIPDEDDNTREAPMELDAMLKIKNIHENILKLCLVAPSFEELHNFVLEKDYVRQSKEKLADIEKRIATLPDSKDKRDDENECERLRIMLGFLLPEDFMTFIVTYQMQKDRSDVNKLTRKMLLNAGFLADKYAKRPSEFLEGAFTEKQKVDIDVASLNYVHEYREMKQLEKNSSGMTWKRGGKKRYG